MQARQSRQASSPAGAIRRVRAAQAALSRATHRGAWDAAWRELKAAQRAVSRLSPEQIQDAEELTEALELADRRWAGNPEGAARLRAWATSRFGG